MVWGLIFYACWRFHRRSDDEVPIQTRYNLPLEIFYTIAPIIMVVVFFVHTERTQNLIQDDVPDPDVTIYVVGQQWTWTFNYMPGGDIPTPDDQVALQRGRGGHPPTLVLPVDKTVEFKLHSPDVIHDFGVPGFLEKMDVIPGPKDEDNHFQVTPIVEGDLPGQVLRAVRGLPLAHALQRQDRQRRRLPGLPADRCRPRATSPTSRCSAGSRQPDAGRSRERF